MVRPPDFEIRTEENGTGLRLAVSGELDMDTARTLVEHLEAPPLGAGVDALTLDLSHLSFMDSSGLRLLIDLSDRARREGWRLSMIPPTDESALVVLRATGADSELPFSWDGVP